MRKKISNCPACGKGPCRSTAGVGRWMNGLDGIPILNLGASFTLMGCKRPPEPVIVNGPPVIEEDK